MSLLEFGKFGGYIHKTGTNSDRYDLVPVPGVVSGQNNVSSNKYMADPKAYMRA